MCGSGNGCESNDGNGSESNAESNVYGNGNGEGENKEEETQQKWKGYDDVRRARYMTMIAKRKREMKDFTYNDHDQLGTRKTLLTKRYKECTYNEIKRLCLQRKVGNK